MKVCLVAHALATSSCALFQIEHCSAQLRGMPHVSSGGAGDVACGTDHPFLQHPHLCCAVGELKPTWRITKGLSTVSMAIQVARDNELPASLCDRAHSFKQVVLVQICSSLVGVHTC